MVRISEENEEEKEWWKKEKEGHEGEGMVEQGEEKKTLIFTNLSPFVLLTWRAYMAKLNFFGKKLTEGTSSVNGGKVMGPN